MSLMFSRYKEEHLYRLRIIFVLSLERRQDIVNITAFIINIDISCLLTILVLNCGQVDVS